MSSRLRRRHECAFVCFDSTTNQPPTQHACDQWRSKGPAYGIRGSHVGRKSWSRKAKAAVAAIRAATVAIPIETSVALARSASDRVTFAVIKCKTTYFGEGAGQCCRWQCSLSGCICASSICHCPRQAGWLMFFLFAPTAEGLLRL